MKKINKNIVPISYSDSGIHPERKFHDRIKTFLDNYHIKEIPSSIVHSEFTVFDFLIFPQHSPVRTSKNVIYVSDEISSEDEVSVAFYEKISNEHKKRFGNDLDMYISERKMLLSHTTASLANSIAKDGPQEIFTLSKTYRNKTERKEKTQLEIALCDRSIPEVLRFTENFLSHILQKKVQVSLDSNFFYFCEPSFSLVAEFERGKTYTLGAGGVMREELTKHISKAHKSSVNHIIYLGISYQKLLNIFLQLPPNKYNIDYNELSSSTQL